MIFEGKLFNFSNFIPENALPQILQNKTISFLKTSYIKTLEAKVNSDFKSSDGFPSHGRSCQESDQKRKRTSRSPYSEKMREGMYDPCRKKNPKVPVT